MVIHDGELNVKKISKTVILFILVNDSIETIIEVFCENLFKGW